MKVFGKSNAVGEPKHIKALIEPNVLESISESLIEEHAELVVKGLLEKSARDELKHLVTREHSAVVKGNEELIDYIVQEIVGTGIIEEIIKDPSITDIGFNGTDLIVESNDKKMKYEGSTKVTEDYIIKIIKKFAIANGLDFSEKEPSLNTEFGNIRLNAVHKVNSPYGTTMSMRLVRPKLVLNKDTFSSLAPMYMYDFFKAAIEVKRNVVISGETGTGKTELQKLLVSFIPFSQKIIMIEDVQESHVKDMFKDKDIYSWLTSDSKSITDLLADALRNNPRWIIIAETLGKEAYEMYQAVLSGHKIITTLHAINARAIPRRMVGMAKMGYSVSEKSLEQDIRRYFDYGVHIERVDYNGSVVRYLAEVVEFGEDEDRTIFEQHFDKGRLVCTTGKLSDDLKNQLEIKEIELNFPENSSTTRSIVSVDSLKNQAEVQPSF